MQAVTVAGTAILDRDLNNIVMKFPCTVFWCRESPRLFLGYPQIKKNNVFYIGIITKAIDVQMYAMWVLDGLYEKMRDSLRPYGLWDDKLFGIWTLLIKKENNERIS